MNNFNPNQCLSPHLAIRDVEDILYEYRISLTSVSEDTKRLRINNPKVLFVISFVELIKRIAIFMTDDNDILRLQILGDIGVYFCFKNIWTLMVLFSIILTILIHIIYFINNTKGMKNEHYAILRMISGRHSPRSFGIYKYNDVIKLLKHFRFINLNKINVNILLFTYSVFHIVSYYYQSCQTSDKTYSLV